MNQRERAFGAMVAICTERGYEATSVASVIALAGISRRDFYKYWSDKQACFLATLEAILERLAIRVAQSYDGRGSALKVFIEAIIEQPAAARLCFVESYRAGPEALALMDKAVEAFTQLYIGAFQARNDDAPMPPDLVRAIVGGLRNVIYGRLLHSQEADLRQLADDLWAWSFSYEVPREPLRGRRKLHGAPSNPVPSSDPAERIIAVAQATMAEKGYMATTISEVVERASISFSTFYEHFDSKEALLAAILDAGEARLFAAVLPAYRRAREWPEGIRGGLEAMFAFFAAEPDFARVAVIELNTADRAALEHRERTIAALRDFLEPGFRQSPTTSRIIRETIAAAIYALLYDQIATKDSGRLAESAALSTYIALAPFIGADEACAVANGRKRKLQPGAP